MTLGLETHAEARSCEKIFEQDIRLLLWLDEIDCDLKSVVGRTPLPNPQTLL